MIKYPVYRPVIGELEKRYVNECLDSTWVSSKGRFIAEFERGFADFAGTRHAASVCNGTVALHLALTVLGLGPGDEVLVPTLTYIASVNAITYTGARPVFVESLPDSWQMDPTDVERRIGDRTRAIMAVHLYGHPCDMDRLTEIAARHDLILIEDCAEAIGSEYRGRKVGTFGQLGCFSFYGNKILTTGEGGMVVCDDAAIDAELRRYKGQGLVQNREYWHDRIGFNYRMTNICAAIGLAQLQSIERVLEQKQAIAAWYQEELSGSAVRVQPSVGPVRHSYWMVSILVPHPATRNPLREHLAAASIETRPVFYPVHSMPIYPGTLGDFPIAEGIASRGINLPSYPQLTRPEVSEICASIRSFVDGG